MIDLIEYYTDVILIQVLKDRISFRGLMDEMWLQQIVGVSNTTGEIRK